MATVIGHQEWSYARMVHKDWIAMIITLIIMYICRRKSAHQAQMVDIQIANHSETRIYHRRPHVRREQQVRI